jgi:hypothetical protein
MNETRVVTAERNSRDSVNVCVTKSRTSSAMRWSGLSVSPAMSCMR